MGIAIDVLLFANFDKSIPIPIPIAKNISFESFTFGPGSRFLRFLHKGSLNLMNHKKTIGHPINESPNQPINE